MKKVKGENLWVKAKTRNDKNRNGFKGEALSKVEKLLAKKDWKRARFLLQEELLSEPMDHWLWMMLSLALYEERDYEKALLCSQRAVQLKPDCPLALWHYAGDLYMTGHEPSALVIWNMLLDMDLETIAYGEDGEGMDWALQLVNDVHYRIGRYYQWKGDDNLARESFKKYVHNRKRGVTSIYDLKKVEEFLCNSN